MRIWFSGPRIGWFRVGASFNATPKYRVRYQQQQRGTPLNGSFVYVIVGDHNMSKIGISTNPEARLSHLRTASAFPIWFAFVGYTEGDAYSIEQRAHEMLDNHRCNGEWFDVLPEMAVAAIHGASYQLGHSIQEVDADSIPKTIYAFERKGMWASLYDWFNGTPPVYY